MGSREKDQADFDLERFIGMFDEALTSDDPRVIDALRNLMMITALTRPEARNQMSDRQSGPLRRLFEDMRHMNQRMARMDEEIRNMNNQHRAREVYSWEDQDKYTMVAAQKMAAQIDADVLAQMKAASIDIGKIRGLK